MNRDPLRLQALLAALWLTVFTQQPVLPATICDGSSSQERAGMPVVMDDASATSGKRYMFFYSDSNSVCLATSEDGARFTPAGVVLKASQAFAEGENVVEASIGEPSVAWRDRQFVMSFYRIGTDASGEVIDAGIAKATSPDGIKWTVAPSAQVSVQIVGHNTHADGLIERLKRLANAYSESAM